MVIFYSYVKLPDSKIHVPNHNPQAIHWSNGVVSSLHDHLGGIGDIRHDVR